MECPTQSGQDGSDRFERLTGDRPFDSSAVAWLVGEGVRYLHAASAEGELAYRRVVELLGQSPEAVKTIVGLSRRVSPDDAGLRWSLLYLLGEIGDRNAAEFLVRAAMDPLPDEERRQACETVRDVEILVRTMAVEALWRVATRHPETGELVLQLISQRPARQILIEAVKAAVELGLRDKVVEILPREDHWMLDIRKVKAEELAAEPERQDSKERSFTPPRSRCDVTTPAVTCCRLEK